VNDISHATVVDVRPVKEMRVHGLKVEAYGAVLLRVGLGCDRNLHGYPKICRAQARTYRPNGPYKPIFRVLRIHCRVWSWVESE